MNEPLPPLVAAPPPVAPLKESEIRTWHMWCHLSALSALVGVPFGNILGPVLVWQIKKGEIPSVEAHAKAVLNWQLTLLIVNLGGGMAVLLLCFLCVGFLLLPVFLGVVVVLGLMNLVFTIIGGIKANNGVEFRYPFGFKLL